MKGLLMLDFSLNYTGIRFVELIGELLPQIVRSATKRTAGALLQPAVILVSEKELFPLTVAGRSSSTTTLPFCAAS